MSAEASCDAPTTGPPGSHPVSDSGHHLGTGGDTIHPTPAGRSKAAAGKEPATRG